MGGHQKNLNSIQHNIFTPYWSLLVMSREVNTPTEDVLPQRGRSKKKKSSEEIINKSLEVLGFSSWTDLEKGKIFPKIRRFTNSYQGLNH